MSGKIVFAYWAIRGLGQPGRLLLEYAGFPYVDKRYSVGPAPEFSREEWLKEKFNLGLDFPNLPYLIDGDIKITQSNACYRYIANKAGLYGKTDKDRAYVDMLADQVMDFRNAVVRVCYSQDEAVYQHYINEALPQHLANFEKFLSNGNKTWLIGDSLTFPDFHLYELLDQNATLFQGSLDKYPALIAYTKRFAELPKIKEYINSDRFHAAPINNSMAKFGFK